MPFYKASSFLKGKRVLPEIKNKKNTVLNNGDLKNASKLRHFVIDPDKGFIIGGIGKNDYFCFEKMKKINEQEFLIKRELPVDLKEKFVYSLKSKIFLIKARVETESGHYLGKIRDFEFDDISWRVERIFISDKSFFRIITDQLQIPHQDILNIGSDTVIVKDGLVKRGFSQKTDKESEFVSIGSGATLAGK